MFGICFNTVDAISHWDEEGVTVEIKKKPWLTEWEDRGLTHIEEGFRPWELGYRFLEHKPYIKTTVYARPFPIWLYLRVCLGVARAGRDVLQWLYRRGVVHMTRPAGLAFRWRDVRLGSGRK